MLLKYWVFNVQESVEMNHQPKEENTYQNSVSTLKLLFSVILVCHSLYDIL